MEAAAGNTNPGTSLSRADGVVAVGVAMAALAVYLLTLAPTVTGEDSGELIAAAYTLGIPHPPGYPLWTVLAHFFTWLPFGSVAWRVNLSSAVFAAGAVGLMVPILRKLDCGRVAAAGGALALAFSLDFWRQSLIAEVYTLNAFLLALLILLLLVWRERRKDWLLLLFALLYGLSLANHNTMHLCAPFFAVFVLAVERPSWRRFGFYALLALLALCAAFVAYLYLILRAQADPAVNWGNPDTLERWWRHVAREQYAFMLSQYPRSPDRFMAQFLALTQMWLDQFSWWLYSAAAIAGWYVLARRQPWTGAWLVSLGLFIAVAFFFVQNPHLHREWLWVMRVFPIPLHLVTAIGLGVMIDAGGRWETRGQGWVIAFAVLLTISLLVFHWPRVDKSGYYWAEDYGRNVLNSLPPDAIYYPEADHAAFPIMYLQVVEGLRPDVTHGRKYGYVDMALAPELVEEFGLFPQRRHEPEIFAQVLRQTDRPVCFPSPLKLPYRGLVFVPHGLTYRAQRPNEAVQELEVWETYAWRNSPPEGGDDYTVDLIQFEIAFEQARQAMMRGEMEEGMGFLQQAEQAYGPDYVFYNNAGVLCAQHGLYDEARGFFESALVRDPYEGSAQANLERLDRRG